MARFTFRLPDIGEGISEAEIVAWHVKLGDRVEEDQSVADMMTDKATVEMESPVSGTVVELAGEVGDQVPIGSALMVIETDVVEASPATEEAVLEAENPGVEEAQTPSPLWGEGAGEKGSGLTRRSGAGARSGRRSWQREACRRRPCASFGPRCLPALWFGPGLHPRSCAPCR